MLNKKSGLLGVSGVSADLRDVEEKLTSGTPEERARCHLAIDVFSNRIAKIMASMFISLKRVDCIVFTGGIGENAALIRQKVMESFEYRGFKIDQRRNNQRGVEGFISDEASATRVMVVKTNEECNIAHHTRMILGMEEFTTADSPQTPDSESVPPARRHFTKPDVPAIKSIPEPTDTDLEH